MGWGGRVRMRAVSDVGCDCDLEAELYDLPLFLRRVPAPPWIYFRSDSQGRRVYVEARADDFMAGGNA